MGRLSPAMLAELQRPSPEVTNLVEIDLPDGTTWRISEEGVAAVGLGYYEPRIAEGSLAEFPLSAIDWELALQTTEPTFTINDPDLFFANLLGRQYPLEESPARVFLASRNVERSQWFQSYGGVLASWEQTGRIEWQLRLRPNDRALRSPIGRVKVESYDFPNSAQDVMGSVAPIIVGPHSDAGKGQQGALAALLVDKLNFRWLVGRGRLVVPRTYAPAGQLRTSGYSIVYELRNGRLFTLVDFAADPGGEVRVDVLGHDTNGDGSGALIAEPTAVLLHVLANYLVNDHESGPWFSPPDWIDTEALEEVAQGLSMRAGGAGYVSSVDIRAEITGSEFLNQWCASHGVIPFWRHDGKLSFKLDDACVTTVYPETVVRFRDEVGDSFRHGTIARCSKEVAVQYGGHQLEVTSPLSRGESVDSLKAPQAPNVYP